MLRIVLLTCSLSFLICSASAAATPVMPADATHAWVGLKDASSLDNWVRWHIVQERRLVAELLSVKGPRTVENTLLPFDRAEMHLTLAGGQSNILFEVHPRKAIRDKAQDLVQVVSAEQTSVALNQDIYRALAAVDTSHANGATRHYMEHTLLEYRLGGVDKDQATREKVRKLQDQIAEVSLKFSRNVQDDVRTIPVTDKSELDGLPADYISRHKAASDGTITLNTDSPDFSPVMSYAKSGKLRRAMFLAYNERAYPANKSVLENLLEARQEVASTLGFKTWADLATADLMMASAKNMLKFLDEVDDASRDRAKHEFDLLQEFARGNDSSALPLTASDAGYWNEQYRRTAYSFDSQSVRPYFPYAQVEAGILKTASRLFHLEFRKVAKADVWDRSVHAYDVYDKGQKAGRIYLDMHPREGKDKWFSESGVIPGMLGEQLPEAALICNFSGGVAGDPGLMQFDEVVTFFHEFGHMMHEVLGGKQRWAGQSGTSTEGDFVEAPSQMLEEMFHDPAILQSFAKHYETGETLPLEVISRMNRASYFGRASWIQRQLFLSTYALQLHDQKPESLDFDKLLKEDYARFSPYEFVDGNRFYTSFTHLTGYSSNYYTYVLDKVIAVDFFAAFDAKNLLDGPAALRYRKTVLEPGSSKPAAQLVVDFLGRRENIEALKHWMDREFDSPPSKAEEIKSEGTTPHSRLKGVKAAQH
jgi:thimet oligopeptidase